MMEREELMALGLDDAGADKVLEETEKIRCDYEKRIDDIKKGYEVEKILTDSGAKNIKAVMALIESEDIEDMKEEIEALKSSSETKFLFEKKGSFNPMKSSERVPYVKKNDFEEKLREARKNGDTLEAIRIKQAASAEGIFLV